MRAGPRRRVALALALTGGLDGASAGAVDLAQLDSETLRFARSIDSAADNRELSERYTLELGRLAGGGTARADDELLRSHVFLFVPGFAWRHDPSTGADFARQRHLFARHGIESHLVETDENGLVAANARTIAGAIRHWGVRRPSLIVVSTSKGGPETALALGRLLAPEELARVRAWVSVGGLLRGSPYADRALVGGRRWLAKLVFGWKGLNFDVIPDLATTRRRAALETLRFPDALERVAFIGAPLSTTVSSDARSRFEELGELGPNDGLTLLADELIPGGRALVELGLDHYFRDPQLDRKTLALARAIVGRRGRAASSP